MSVLLVILYHLVAFRFEPKFRPDANAGMSTPPSGADGAISWIKHQVLRELEYAGPLGVQIFFAISGYIITTLLLREFRQNGRISISAFYVRRAFRILPPLWLMLGATFLLTSLGYVFVDRKSFVLSGAFLCNLNPNNCYWLVGHTWSLAVEEQFYLFWPLLLSLIGFRALTQVALALCLLFVAADQSSLFTVDWITMD